jgi:hypothetical protein
VRLPPGPPVLTADAARALWELLFRTYHQHVGADNEAKCLYRLENSR